MGTKKGHGFRILTTDYHPIALTPIIMKCFERLVMQKIKTSLPNTLDPLQFAYRPNRSTDDAISTTLNLALTHLENKDSYVRMLFIDFSSAFNTIIPQQLINKLNLLGLNNSLCNWILDFLTGRPQSVRVGHNTSSTTTLSTGAPHHGGSHLDHQHRVTLQEGTTAPTLSPPAEKSKSPSTHPHHILQGHHWECADQLHHCLVR